MNKIGIPLALLTIIIWASTYISTKILVRTFTPLEISLVRFTIGLIAMNLIAPPWRYRKRKGQSEIPLVIAGVLGIFLYYFLENLATGHTSASNVSIIVTTIPLWTAVLAPLFSSSETFSFRYIWAFLLAITGVLILVAGGRRSGGADGSSISGDLAALGASLVFALYTIALRKADDRIPTLHLTRKTLFYGWLAILAASGISGQFPSISRITTSGVLFHFLFLGLLASALCFVTWALSVRKIGAVRASQFIYLVPFVTVSLSALLLNEKVTLAKAAGLLCIVAGVAISQLDSGKPTGPRKRIFRFRATRTDPS